MNPVDDFLEGFKDQAPCAMPHHGNGGVYDQTAKDDAALALDRPHGHFYYWPFRHWAKASRILAAKRRRVEQECLAMGMPQTMRWQDFPHYAKSMGFTKVADR